ncbi:MAG TPA: metal ABC transporter substrate-binding protein [Candidatus Limnocylindrales bacterium]|nr:metal ABC transporter substrate-binding protein [Candidatus Limnocylindrales bacterium]
MLRSLAVVAASLAMAGCATADRTSVPTAAPQGGPITVLASTTVLADLVRRVGGNRVDVVTLIPAGTDTHTFGGTVDIESELDLVVWNGLGLDDETAVYAPDPAHGLAIAESLDEVEMISDEQGNSNPHVWVDPANASVYLDRIRLTLIGIDPAGQATYDANTDSYLEQLERLEVDIRAQLDALPDENRSIYVTHDGLDYLAEFYGLEVLGTIYTGDDRELTADEQETLVAEIGSSGAQAVIGESHLPVEPAQSIATQAGVPWVQFVFTDSLGADPEPDTYEEATRHNVDLIVAALTLP